MANRNTFWTEADGVIRFSVTSDGTTGSKWIARLRAKDWTPLEEDRKVILSINPTNGVTYHVAVLKGCNLKLVERRTQNIHAEANLRKLLKPSVEVDCLIRDAFSFCEIRSMGLHWIFAMHDHSPIMPMSECDLVGDRWLLAYIPDRDIWDVPLIGFAFIESQVNK